MAKDNNPDIILKLVARSELACQVWADPQNEAFYLPQQFERSNQKPREVAVNPDGTRRAVTPISEGVKVSEPALQITFSKTPKNPELGYLLGSDRELCDIYLGNLDEYISGKMFAIFFNQYNEVIMKSSSRNSTVVKYSTQSAERRNFTVRAPFGLLLPVRDYCWCPETHCQTCLLPHISFAKGFANSDILVVVSARRERNLCHHHRDNVQRRSTHTQNRQDGI